MSGRQAPPPETKSQTNPEFDGLFHNALRKQAVRRLQAHYRKKHGKIYQGNERATLADSNDTRTNFIPKLQGAEAESRINYFASCVSEGRLEDLPYADADFHDYLNEALRLGKIQTCDQLVAPLLLWSDLVEYRNRPKKYSAMRKFRFNEAPQGPFTLANMPAVQAEDVDRFQQELQAIPQSERCYYTINFSHQQEIALLYKGLMNKVRRKRFQPWLQRYVERYVLSAEEQKEFKEFSGRSGAFSEVEQLWYLSFIISKESLETRRYSYLWNNDEIERMASPVCRPGETSTFSLYHNNNPLIISFFLELHKQEPALFNACLNHLNLEKTATSHFRSLIEEDKGEEAAYLLCEHWIKLYPLAGEEKEDYERYVSKHYFGKAAQLLWQASPGGKQMTLCALLNDARGDRLSAPLRAILQQALQTQADEMKGEASRLPFKRWALRLENPEKQKARTAALTLRDFIQGRMSQMTLWFWQWSLLCYLEHGSLMTIMNSYLGGSEMPWVAISPDYDPRDPASPLLCSVVYTQAATVALQQALCGKNVMGAELSYGAFGLHDYRSLGENAGALGRLKPHKPTELTHPALAHHHNVHGVQPYTGQITRHDLGHNMMNCEEPFQDALNYLKRLLTQEKGYSLSQSIYHLVDLPTTVGSVYRQSKIEGQKSLLSLQATWLKFMLPLAGRELDKSNRTDAFWTSLARHDEHLMLMQDLFFQREEWKKRFNDTYPIPLLVDEPVLHSMFKLALEKEPVAKQQRIFYVLAFRLQEKISQAGLLQMLRGINLKHILQWERNAGLRFYRDLGFGDHCRVEELSADALYTKLQAVAAVVLPYARRIPHFSPFQGAIFSILAYRLRDHSEAVFWCDILSQVDLTKILRFRSSNNKLYFVDPRTNDRQPNLLTWRSLPADDQELAFCLIQAYREVYPSAPALHSETETILHCLLSGDPKADLSEKLVDCRGKLPPAVLETAFENANLNQILSLLNSQKATVQINALKVLAERQQSNQRFEPSALSHILHHFLMHADKPNKNDFLLLENLFHSEILLSQQDFLNHLLGWTCGDQLRDTALCCWLQTIVRNLFWHQEGSALLALVKQPFFALEPFNATALQALDKRQEARIAFSAKLAPAELTAIRAILAPQNPVFEVGGSVQEEIKQERVQPLSTHRISRSLGKWPTLLLCGIVLAGLAVTLAATGILAPLVLLMGLPATIVTMSLLGFLAPMTVWKIGELIYRSCCKTKPKNEPALSSTSAVLSIVQDREPPLLRRQAQTTLYFARWKTSQKPPLPFFSLASPPVLTALRPFMIFAPPRTPRPPVQPHEILASVSAGPAFLAKCSSDQS